VREIDPNSPQAHAVLGLAWQQKGDCARGIAEFRRCVDLSGKDPDALMRLGCACAWSGDSAAARDTLRTLRARSAHEYVAPGSLAGVALALGDTELALSQLDAGVEQRGSSLLMLAVDPAFAPLRGNARFQALLQKIGLPA
jgi:Flp pilus assembly protein TadD